MRRHRRIKTQHLTKLHWHRVLIISIIIFCFVFLLTLYWFIFLSNFFQIKNIEIRGLDHPDYVSGDITNYFLNKNQKFVPLWLEKILMKYFKQTIGHRNILLLSNKELSELLMSKYPEFSNVTSKLDVRNNNLIINIISREMSYLVCLTNNECYFMDEAGVIFGKAPQTSGSLIKTIIIDDFTPVIGETVLPAEDLKFLNNLFQVAAQEDSPLRIKAIEISSPHASSIKIITDFGWYLLINFNSDLDKIMKIINGLLLGELKNKESQLKYIDGRYLPRVYYKLK